MMRMTTNTNTTFSVKINRIADSRHFRMVVADLRELGGRYNPDSKTWTMGGDSAHLAVCRKYAEYAGMSDREIILERVGRWVTVVDDWASDPFDLRNIDQPWSAL